MKNIKLLLLVLFLLLINFKVDAYNNCYKSGYTVVSVNGIFTDSIGARENKENLKKRLPSSYNNEPVIVDYLYNSTHLAGVGDVVDVVKQGFFNNKSDFDLVEMLNDASDQVTTQKVLLVGHSQGNFYVNNFYDKIAGKNGGVPLQSIGVYGVATPADRVAGGGKYLTSDTDSVIATLVGSVKNIMTPNTHIDLNGIKSNGHDFSEIYLKYRGNKIVSDIKSSFDYLNRNEIQSDYSSCISPQKISLGHKVSGAVLSVADVLVKGTVYAGSFAYNTITDSLKSIASIFGNNINKNLAAAGLHDEQNVPDVVHLVSASEDNAAEIVVGANSNQPSPEVEIKKIETENIPVIEPKIDSEIPKIIPIPEVPVVQNTENNNHSGGGGGHLNSSEEVVVSDMIAPIITLLGKSVITIPVDTVYVDAGATALDNKDGVITVVTTGNVDTTTIGTYTITYTAADSANNVATLIRVINVVQKEIINIPEVDIIAPVITILGESIITIPVGAIYVDAGATAIDNKDGVVAVITTGAVDTAVIGTYTLTYTTTDISNNVATLIRVIKVVPKEITNTPGDDMIAPVISLIGESIISIDVDTVYIDAGATAIDNKDGSVAVVKTGIVDITTIGAYTITYTAIDIANNAATLTRIISVIAKIPPQNNPPLPVSSTAAILSLPNSGAYAGDGLDPSRGRKNLTQFIFQVVYKDSNNHAPKNIKLHIKNTTTGVLLPDVDMNQIVLGSDILSDGNYTNGELYMNSSTFDQGDYSYSFSADDHDGNFTKIEESNNLRFSAISSNYIYVPKYTFGSNNGDGNDWQVWAFNGSNVYDWTDTYVNNYLREQFKIQTYTGGFWCSQCLQRGIFNHDPQKGFETADLSVSSLENNPQNSMNGKTYNVAIQWDALGYTYTITNDSVVYATGHTNVDGMNNNLWVGWDGSYNSFKNFPTGDWYGVPYGSPMERTGGGSMILQPYPVYDPLAVQTPNPTPIPTPEPSPVLSSTKLITSFDFKSLTPNVNGVIDNTEHNIKLTVPYGTVINALSPTITISDKSSILPSTITPQDFTNPFTYIVKAEDSSTSSYVVTVIVSPNPNPDPTPDPTPDPDPVVPDNALPIIKSYTLEGSQNSLTINPLVNNLDIIFNSNKNVNWMSIKIEKESDAKVYKMFQSGGDCVDGTSICTKIWDGKLSSGELLQSGNYDGIYKIKVHMKDVLNNEFDEYLPSVITVNTQ